jgi:hypothetical protein
VSDFSGFVDLEDTLHLALQTRVGDLPTQADAFPIFRVYGQSGLLANAGGTATAKHTGTITDATNANPIVIASTGHGLQTGMRVTITGVVGNTNANTTSVITRVDADHFSLNGVSGNGAYVSGGTFTVTGLYDLAVVCSAANGFDAGTNYTVIASYQISSSAYSQNFNLGVV